MTREKKSTIMLWVIFLLLTVLSISDLFILISQQHITLIADWYRPPMFIGDYFRIVNVPQGNIYLEVNQDFLQYYFFFMVFFFVYFYWYHELNDHDELTIPAEERMPTILFDKRLARITEINWLAPFIVALITGNLCPDGILTIPQALTITAIVQLGCYALYLMRFIWVWQYYRHQSSLSAQNKS